MAVIDVGPGATDRSSYADQSYSCTYIELGNPANDTGSLDTFELWVNASVSNCIVGTFYGSGKYYTMRDYETIGSVTSGSKQTFTGKNCDVESGDFIGQYEASGKLELDKTGQSGNYLYYGNAFDGSQHEFTFSTGDATSIYATGETAAVGNPYHYYLQQ